jgi:cytohesin
MTAFRIYSLDFCHTFSYYQNEMRRAYIILAVISLLLGCGRSQEKQLQEPGVKIMFEAVDDGDTKKIAELVAGGIDVNSTNEVGQTILHRVVYLGDSELAKSIIGLSADINIADKDGMTPLHFAASSGDTRIIKLLISKGANQKSRDSKGQTPLHIYLRNWSATVMIENDPTELVGSLLGDGAALNAKDEDGNTPLHVAAASGNANLVELLLKAGGDRYLENNRGDAPMHVATRKQHIDVVATLCSVDGDANLRNELGETPLHISAGKKSIELVKSLLDRNTDVNALDNKGRTPIDVAASLSRTDIMLMLRNHGGKFEKTESDTLVGASKVGDIEKARVILAEQTGAGASKRDVQNAFAYAVANGDVDFMQLLFENGAEPDDRGGFSSPPLHIATRNAQKTAVAFLISARADINARDTQGLTPLLIVAKLDKPCHTQPNQPEAPAVLEIAELLLSAGSDVNAVDKSGKTPLDWAYSDQLKKCLSRHGAKTSKELEEQGK